MKKIMARIAALLTTTFMAATLLAGCGKAEDPAAAEQVEETVEEPAAEAAEEVKTEDAAAGEIGEAPYLTKGVYANYAKEAENPDKTYFYVFSDDSYGYTADGAAEGMGLPFSVIEQADGKVTISFGGQEEENRDTLVITGVEPGFVYGYFEDVPDRELVFELIEGEDPTNFSAENYVNGPEESVYHDGSGWSVKYNANLFAVNGATPMTTFVYLGESAGTNMITATYTIENKAEEAVKELGKSYDNATYQEGIFPGTEDVTGYWVTVPVDKEGSGAYMTAVARDYMDGALIFEVDGHQSGDDEMDMAVSDALASIIDSLTFDFE